MAAPGDRYAPPPRLRTPAGKVTGALAVLQARARRHRLVLRLRTPRRRLAWADLREILRDAGAVVPLQ